MNDFVIYEPKVSFSYLGDKVTITLDNTNNDYENLIPHAFIENNSLNSIEFKDGVKVVKRYEEDSSGDYDHELYDFIISRKNTPTAINYI